MKIIKNTESKENNTSLKIGKEGKIKKNKPKKQKNFKDEVGEVEDLDLASKIKKSTNLKTSSRALTKKSKSAKLGGNQEPTVNVSNESKPENKKQKKSKQNEDKQKKSQAEKQSKELTEAELKKLEKKKAKKLAKKLKKLQRKSEIEGQNVTEIPNTNGVKQVEKLDSSTNKNIALLESPSSKNSTSSKVLTKKEKKAQRRQIIKEQKLAEKQSRDPAVDVATVFVGNLPVNTKRIQLVRLFKDFGPVNSIRLRSAGGLVLHKHKQRKNAGALNAYVVLKNKETAEKAVSLNGVEFKGHHLRVTLTLKNPRSHEKDEAKRTVFVGNLKYSATEESLRDIFSSCGEIDYVRCIRDGDKGCKGVAFVCFKMADAVGLALELNQTIVDERPINVERFRVGKLGAKEAREAQAEKEVNSKKGAKQRIDGKKGKKEITPGKSTGEGDDVKKPKKSEFRGVKVEGLKKKQKSKKKKSRDQTLQLAKKIAPKPKIE